MIGGAISGNGIVRVIVRALGPTLGQFGVPNVLADPTLELHDANGSIIASNNNWQDTQPAEIQASGFALPTHLRQRLLFPSYRLIPLPSCAAKTIPPAMPCSKSTLFHNHAVVRRRRIYENSSCGRRAGASKRPTFRITLRIASFHTASELKIGAVYHVTNSQM